jgi:ribosome maturation factor RimP
VLEFKILTKGGTLVTPFFLQTMAANTPEEKIEVLLQPLLEGSDMFLTNIRIKPTNNIKVFLDADSGLDIGKCATINRKLYHAMEEAGLYPDGDFSLEVSSPGIDEPLNSLRQYKKNVGRTIEVTPLAGEPIVGLLKEVGEDSLHLSIKGTKKAPPMEKEIPLTEIKTVIVQVTF